jgi:hypothetical protein
VSGKSAEVHPRRGRDHRGNAVIDPDSRILAMLGARADHARGNSVEKVPRTLTGT